MRDLAQIIRDNGDDNTPGLDTHNLTGRAQEDVRLTDEDYRLYEEEERMWLATIGYYEDNDWSLEDIIDCE